jgi:hypothetical protein
VHNAADSDNKILVGRDDWLFLNNDSNRVIDQISGNLTLSADFDAKWRSLFEYRRAQLDAIECKYGLLIAPNKECVYSNMLPDGIRLSDQRPVYRVLQQAKQTVHAIYPFEELVRQSAIIDVYPKGDTHWNVHGALIGYRKLCSVIGAPCVEDNEIEFFIVERGDLSSKLGMKTSYVQGRIKNPSFNRVFNNDIPNNGNRIEYINTNARLPTCILFRDSFGTIMTDIMAQSFSRLVVIWQANIDYSIVEAEKPDFVISVQAERFLVSPPNDITGKSHAEWVSEKTANPATSVRGRS